MKNGFKILLFCAALVLLLSCTAGVFLLFAAPTNRLQSDFDSFSALDTALAGLQTELHKTHGYPYNPQLGAVEAALEQADIAFGRLDEGSFIRTRSKTIADIYAGLPAWRETVDGGTRSVTGIFTALQADPSLDAALLDAVKTVSADIGGIRASLVAQLPLVGSGIRSYRALSFAVSAAIIVCTWLLGLLAVWLLSRSLSRITRHFTSILDSVSQETGQNAARVQIVAGSQETGGGSDPAVKARGRGDSRGGTVLARMEDFVTGVRAIGDSMKTEVASNVEASTRLSASLENTSATFEVVDGFIESIRGEAQVLEEQIRAVKTALSRVMQGLSNLDTGIVRQKSVVEGSLSSVEGMIRSISDMARDAKRDETVVQHLVHSSDSGQTHFGSTFEQINRINSSISRINGMAAVIENISEQTNMLALNAAIEAAHAGDSGKGFAVVAEEMTKLAEASSESSREIAESIEEIIHDITSMTASSAELDRAFGEMTGDIDAVYGTIVKFSTGLEASNRDGTAVLDTMNTLEAASRGVTADSAVMAEGAGAIETSMAELDMISSRVCDGVGALALMIDGLKDVMNEFKELAGSMKKSGLAMTDKLARLK